MTLPKASSDLQKRTTPRVACVLHDESREGDNESMRESSSLDDCYATSERQKCIYHQCLLQFDVSNYNKIGKPCVEVGQRDSLYGTKISRDIHRVELSPANSVDRVGLQLPANKCTGVNALRLRSMCIVFETQNLTIMRRSPVFFIP